MPETPFILTKDNYYSDEANQRYMSVSQFKDFAGTTSHGSCEEAALMKAKGIFPESTTTAKMVGSFVDSYFEGTLDEFKGAACVFMHRYLCQLLFSAVLPGQGVRQQDVSRSSRKIPVPAQDVI